jgi:hypothetical protein
LVKLKLVQVATWCLRQKSHAADRLTAEPMMSVLDTPFGQKVLHV